MPLMIELITPLELAMLEAIYGPITVMPPQPIESWGEMPEPDDIDEEFEYYRQIMESNLGPVLVR